MPVQVDALAKLIDEADGESTEIPVEALGSDDRIRVLFPEGVLHIQAGQCQGRRGHRQRAGSVRCRRRVAAA
ncbi:hypothetical protein [Kitasatospora acidiphila]|uniref:hypothetical protein n=1 Tax=Kitasatospora acidiphila TaxID=2567942 RepID=UPI003C76C8D0